MRVESCESLHRVKYAVMRKTTVTVSQRPERQKTQSQRGAVNPRPLVGQRGRCRCTDIDAQGRDFDSFTVPMPLCRIRIAAVCDARLRSHEPDGTDLTFPQS